MLRITAVTAQRTTATATAQRNYGIFHVSNLLEIDLAAFGRYVKRNGSNELSDRTLRDGGLES